MKLLDVSTKSHPNTFALVDDEDFDRVSAWKWGVDKGPRTLYARRIEICNGVRVSISMHRFILGVDSASLVDHRDLNGLNNQKSNLRVCTPTQNQCNTVKRSGSSTSRFKGVSRHKRSGLFCANIRIRGRKVWLGEYATEEEAAEVYNLAAIREHGEFARPNLIREVPPPKSPKGRGK